VYDLYKLQCFSLYKTQNCPLFHPFYIQILLKQYFKFFCADPVAHVTNLLFPSTQFLKPRVQWGVEVNGKWNGMIGVITRNEADAAVAAFSMSPFRNPVLDFLKPLMVGT
jgi:hypothetical protein